MNSRPRTSEEARNPLVFGVGGFVALGVINAVGLVGVAGGVDGDDRKGFVMRGVAAKHTDGFQVWTYRFYPSGAVDSVQAGPWFEAEQDAVAYVAGRLPRTRRAVLLSVHRCGKPVTRGGAVFEAYGEA